MKFTLEIELGNEAMQRYSDIREAIAAALKPERRSHNVLKPGKVSDGDGGHISDTNGNTVGKWEVVDETGEHASDCASRFHSAAECTCGFAEANER